MNPITVTAAVAITLWGVAQTVTRAVLSYQQRTAEQIFDWEHHVNQAIELVDNYRAEQQTETHIEHPITAVTINSIRAAYLADIIEANHTENLLTLNDDTE